MRMMILSYQDAIIKIKQYLNLTGEFDFKCTTEKQMNSKNTIKLANFADKVHLMFRRMYADLQHQKHDNLKLDK